MKGTETRRLFYRNPYTYIWNRITLLWTERLEKLKQTKRVFITAFYGHRFELEAVK
jgi:hypothetical protein